MCHSLYYHRHSMLCHYKCAASNQCSFFLSLFLSLFPLCCWLFVCLCFLRVPVCLVRLLCQASGRRLSQGSPSRLPQLLRQRPALLLLLCSPPVWLFTASSVSINTAAPLLTKAYSRTTGKGHCRAWVQWVRHDKNKKTPSTPVRSLATIPKACQQPPARSLSHTMSPSPSLSFTCLCFPSCFTFLQPSLLSTS